jgi:divalent metal cation (Fe/Co/Zn/Cd) transporter
MKQSFLLFLSGLFVWVSSVKHWIDGSLQTTILILTVLTLIAGLLDKLGLLENIKKKIKSLL